MARQKNKIQRSCV